MAQDSRELDNKESRFVDEYLIDLDVERAAIEAGYSESVAKSKAYQWVSNGKVKPHVHQAILDAINSRSERTEITQDRVLEELAHIGFLDIRKAFDDDGNLIPIHEMPEDVARAIGGFEIDNVKASEGGEQISSTKKVKLLDKKSSLELIGKHLKMFTDKVAIEGVDGKDLIPETNETELARRIAFALMQAAEAKDG